MKTEIYSQTKSVYYQINKYIKIFITVHLDLQRIKEEREPTHIEL